MKKIAVIVTKKVNPYYTRTKEIRVFIKKDFKFKLYIFWNKLIGNKIDIVE